MTEKLFTGTLNKNQNKNPEDRFPHGFAHLITLSSYDDTTDNFMKNITVLIVHRIVLFWEPDRCFQDGGQENRREVGTYFITISSVYL